MTFAFTCHHIYLYSTINQEICEPRLLGFQLSGLLSDKINQLKYIQMTNSSSVLQMLFKHIKTLSCAYSSIYR